MYCNVLCVCPNLYVFSWTLRFPYVSSSGTSSVSTYNQILCLSQHLDKKIYEKMFWHCTKASSESIVFILLLLPYEKCMLSLLYFCDFFPLWRKDCIFEDFTKNNTRVWKKVNCDTGKLILLYIVFSLQIENSGCFTIFTHLRTRAHW